MPQRVARQLPVGLTATKLECLPRCYHHIEMRPETFGRVVGIGLRVAGRVAGQRLSAGAQSGPGVPGPRSANPASPNVAGTLRSAGRARSNFGGAFANLLKPFRRVGGILWLEITGVFFFLPVVVFTPTLWRTRLSFAHGPDHRTFVASLIVVVVFFYLGVTSFWRARRK